jgi:hypothetical protein
MANAHFVNLETERARRNPECAPLPFTRRIMGIAKSCAEAPALAIIIGGTGCGKTYALQRAALDIPSLALITINPAVGGQSRGLYHIREELACHLIYQNYLQFRRGYSQVAYFPMREIEDTLKHAWQAGCPVLVLDEAQHAKRGLLDCCRALYDSGHCSLILAGNDEFDLSGLAPLVSRATFEINAATADAADVDGFLDHRRIVQPKARALLHQVATLRGIRGVDEVLRRAGAGGTADVPGLTHIQAAVRSMRFLAGS